MRVHTPHAAMLRLTSEACSLAPASREFAILKSGKDAKDEEDQRADREPRP